MIGTPISATQEGSHAAGRARAPMMTLFGGDRFWLTGNGTQEGKVDHGQF
jgi:hypothetical protein